DFFGKMVANDGDWAIGKSVMIHPRPGQDAIRDLQTPGRLSSPVSVAGGKVVVRPYPASTAQEAPMLTSCDGSNDSGNVHYNSTIPSHAMYLAAQAAGKDVMQTLEYVALTHAMGPRTGFRQYGAAIRSVCRQLFDAQTCQTVGAAFARAGI